MYQQVCELARQAGEEIMRYYQGQRALQTRQKDDNSPVTAADVAAHQLICQGLSRLTPEIPLLSEEAPPSWQQRQHWQRYWLIDPLDGTKEFLKHNDEFTVNIALIDQGQPVFGVVYLPVQQILYSAIDGVARKQQHGQSQLIQVQQAKPPVILISHTPANQALQQWLEQLGEHQQLAVGSSLKFCLLAEGKAQCYPRFNQIHGWDTAAGHAVALAAGALMQDWQGKPVDYTVRESLLNPAFRLFVPDADASYSRKVACS